MGAYVFLGVCVLISFVILHYENPNRVDAHRRSR